MEPSTEEVYAAFEKKVKKTIYIDNLSPLVTKAVLETAFNQFGTVNNVQFIPTHFASSSVYAALVEMQSVNQADEIVREMGDSPFMISGMPRPVRAQKAQVEMFDDRPKKRQRNIVCRWMDPSDPKFEVAKKMKSLTKKHAAEASFLMMLTSRPSSLSFHFPRLRLLFQQQLAEEEKLHNQQSETLKANYKKFELIDSTRGDGTAKRLANYYETKLHDF